MVGVSWSVPTAHHGANKKACIGKREAQNIARFPQQSPVNVTCFSASRALWSSTAGIRGQWYGSSAQNHAFAATDTPPPRAIRYLHACLQVLISTENADGTVIKLIQYGVPTRPGWCRMINRQVRRALKR